MDNGLETMYGKASGHIIKRFYTHELDKPNRLLHKLTDTHFYYNCFDKMKVYLATQIISETCAKAVEKMLEDDGFFKPRDVKSAKATLIFCRNMNKLFDLLNAKDVKDRNPFKQGLSVSTIGHLTDLKVYVDSIKHTGSNTVYWLEGLKQTINAVIGLYDEYFRAIKAPLLTRLINQDPLENLFGLIRRMNTNSQNPYLLDFLRILSKIISTKMDWKLSNTNCEWDQSSILSFVDVKGVIAKNEETVSLNPKSLNSKDEDEWIDFNEVYSVFSS